MYICRNKNRYIMENKEILQHVVNGVEIEITNYECDYVGIKKAKANGYYFIDDKLHVTYEGGSTGKSVNEFKLILRPLSDLITEINIDFDDEKFTPYEVIRRKGGCNSEVGLHSKIDKGTLGIKFAVMLLEWHFDVFGLIEKGLAIDINTLTP
jgi:hypothetical protein